MSNQPDLPDAPAYPTDGPAAGPTPDGLADAPPYPSAETVTSGLTTAAALAEAPPHPSATTLADAPAYPQAGPLQPAPPAYPTPAPLPAPAPAPAPTTRRQPAPEPEPEAEAEPEREREAEAEAEADADAMSPAQAAALLDVLGTTETEQQLEFTSGRTELRARQRGADAAAISGLLLHLPNFICSFIVVYLIAGLLPTFLTWLLVILWLLSGALVFHRPTERVIARYLLNLRYPTRKELAWLNPIWSEVSKRAGIEGSGYDLWIEDSGDLNAYAAAGHIVGVTHFSMTTLPPAELAGVLAHELGHHTGGHAWSSLLGLWYSLPGRLAWQALRRITAGALALARYFFCLGAVILLVAAVLVAAAALTFWPLLLVLVAPYLLAAVSRKAELRADRTAAELGFAQVMVQVLTKIHGAELAAQREPGAKAALTPGLAAKLLSSHPDYHTRLRQLEEYLPS